jgi:hypothetical protein
MSWDLSGQPGSKAPNAKTFCCALCSLNKTDDGAVEYSRGKYACAKCWKFKLSARTRPGSSLVPPTLT